MYLNGIAAITMLTRNRIPTVFGTIVDPIETIHENAPVTMLRMSMSIDRERAAPVLTLAVAQPITREESIAVNPLHGLHNYQVVTLANALELPRKTWGSLIDAAQNLYRVLISADALSITLDPLMLEPSGRMLLQDAHIYLDDSASFRHPEFALGPPAEADDERLARMAGISYIRLDGQIGVIANGAGLAMATMDIVAARGLPFGLRPANFMDIGGGARSDTIETALRLMFDYHALNALVFNVFGGMTRADEVAQGIIAATSDGGLKIPLILRITGVHAQSGRTRLEQASFDKLRIVNSLNAAVDAAIEAAKGTPIS